MIQSNDVGGILSKRSECIVVISTPLRVAFSRVVATAFVLMSDAVTRAPFFAANTEIKPEPEPSSRKFFPCKIFAFKKLKDKSCAEK